MGFSFETDIAIIVVISGILISFGLIGMGFKRSIIPERPKKERVM